MKIFYILFISLLLLSCSDNALNHTTSNEPFTVSRVASKASLAPVPINAKILLNISTDLNKSSINASSVFIKSSTNKIIAANISYQQKIITITPKVYLQPNSDYTIFVTTAISSTQGEHLSKDANISFTSSGTLPDISPPQYLGTNIGSTRHPKEIYYFQFDEAISPLSITEDMFTITRLDHNISATARVSGDLLIFTPQEPLQPGPPYNITLELDNRIQDLSGNAMTVQTPINLSLSESISNPYPSVDFNLSSNTYTIGNDIYCLESNSNLLFVGGKNGLVILDFDLTSTSFSLLSSLTSLEVGTVYSITKISNEQRLYIGSSNGFYIIDTTTITSPTIISYFSTTAPVYNLSVNANTVYLAATLLGLIQLDISDETKPNNVYSSQTNGIAFDTYLTNTDLYVADYNETLRVSDITGTKIEESIPSLPAYRIRNFTYNSDQNHLITATGIGGLVYIDLGTSTPSYSTPQSQPALPTLPSFLTKTVVKNNFAYMNLSSLGIFKTNSIDYTSFELLLPQPFIDISTFTYTEDSSATNKYLILADKSGKIYSSKLP